MGASSIMNFLTRDRLFRTIGCVVFVLMLFSCSDSGPIHEPLPPGSTVLAFGDSVTYGTGAGRGEGYPARLAEATGWQITNGGISGDTARAARERLAGLLQRYQPGMVIVELGGNDFLRKRASLKVKEDLVTMVKQCQEAGAIAVLVSVPELSLLRASIGALDDAEIYAEIALETGAVLIPGVFSKVLSNPGLRADRIHPNARGYQALSDGLEARLREVGLLR